MKLRSKFDIKKIYFVIFCIVVFLFDKFLFLDKINSKIIKLFSWQMHINTQILVKFDKVKQLFRSKYDLIKENQQLKVQIAIDKSKIEEYSLYKDENENLKKLLSNCQNIKFVNKNIFLTRPIISFSFPAIEGGKNVSIRKNQMVFIGGVFVGYIGEVFDDYSKVVLLSAKYSKPILVKTSQTNVQGILRGDGKRIILTDIPITENPKLQEEILTVGQQDIEPDIYVGKISFFINEPQDSEKKAIVVQPVDFYSVKVVQVR